MNEAYKALGVSENVLAFSETILSDLKDRFAAIDAIAEANQLKVIAAMQKNRVAANHFNLSTGYGYDDEGRDTLERVYADCFGAEAALVRPQITCGTHALALALGANLLKLKPCLEMREGKLVVCKKYRGSMDKVYRQYIAERLAGKAVVADHAFITHSGEVPEETLSQLTALVRELAPFEEVFVTQAGCWVCVMGEEGEKTFHRSCDPSLNKV